MLDYVAFTLYLPPFEILLCYLVDKLFSLLLLMHSKWNSLSPSIDFCPELNWSTFMSLGIMWIINVISGSLWSIVLTAVIFYLSETGNAMEF